jgi:hypothetical protein
LILVKRSAFIGASLLGLGLALVSGGCSSGEPVMTEAAKVAARKELEETAKANDAAAKAAARPRPAAGVMPP